MAIKIDDLKQIFSAFSSTFTEKKEYLIEMDSIMGDGDLGITMSKIFVAAFEQTVDFEGNDIGKLLMQSGMMMAKTAPSTMGTLMATAFMEAGKLLKSREVMEVADWSLFFDGMKAGIAKRGKTAVGEKTIYDVFSPVSDYVKSNSYESELSLFRDLAPYAQECLEKTADMEAQHGKAACYGEKSKGHVDAGATVAYLLIDTLLQHFERAL